jgi:putative nucleotidyltransferase with HDIG domain
MPVLNEIVPIRINKTFEMPSLSLVLTKILQVLDEDVASAKEIEALILHDPPLSARILKLANSAFYSFQADVKTISHAIPLLGINLVKSLAIGVNIFNTFAQGMKSKTQLVNKLWMHSFGTGILAQEIWTRRSGRKEGEFAFLCGLLHDIGKVVFFKEDGVYYGSIFEKVKSDSDPDITACEVARYGEDHTSIGAILAKQWNFPPELVTAIRKHHDPVGGGVPLSASVAIADCLAKQAQIGYDGDGRMHTDLKELLASLQVSSEEFESLTSSAGSKRAEIEKFFQLSC